MLSWYPRLKCRLIFRNVGYAFENAVVSCCRLGTGLEYEGTSRIAFREDVCPSCLSSIQHVIDEDADIDLIRIGGIIFHNELDLPDRIDFFKGVWLLYRGSPSETSCTPVPPGVVSFQVQLVIAVAGSAGEIESEI